MASVQDRGNGSYLLVVEVGRDAEGKRIKHTKTIKAKGIREARKLMGEFETEVRAGQYIAPEKMKFSAFVEEWEKKYAVKELAPLTLKTYKGHLKNHIISEFGHMRMDQIKPFHIVTFLDTLSMPGARKDGRGETLSSGTIEYIYRVLKNVFNRAMDWKMLKHHPMQSIKKPKVIHAKKEFYDQNDARKAIELLYQEPIMWRILCLAAMIGGFRRGELVALEWSDINFKEGYITIDESISFTENGQAVIGKPKNKTSDDIVEMPDWFMEELKLYQEEWDNNKYKAGDLWLGGEHEYLFHSGLGKALYHTTPSTWWRRFTIRKELKPISLHGLRHSTATLLIEEGASMKAIQERLRHSRYQTTADMYAHVTKKLSKDTTDKFNKFDPRVKFSSTIGQQAPKNNKIVEFKRN